MYKDLYKDFLMKPRVRSLYNSLSNSNYNVKKIIIDHICYSKHAQLLSESDL